MPQETSELSSRGILLHSFPVSAPLENIQRLNKEMPAVHMTGLRHTFMVLMFRIKNHMEHIYVQILIDVPKISKDEIYLNKSLWQVSDAMCNNIRGCPEKSLVPMFIEYGSLKHV